MGWCDAAKHEAELLLSLRYYFLLTASLEVTYFHYTTEIWQC